MTEPFERLRELRIKAGFATAVEVAERFGWNVNTYRSHENGIRALTLRAAEKYAAGFKVSATWLLTGEGDQAPPLSPDELALIQKYRQLSPEGKAAAHALANALTQQAPTVKSGTDDR